MGRALVRACLLASGLALSSAASKGQEQATADFQLAIRFAEGPLYAGVPLLVSVEVRNPAAAELELSQYGLGRGQALKVICRDEEGRRFGPPVPAGFLDYWQDQYYVPPVIPPRTTIATLDMVLLPRAGKYTVEATLATPGGPERVAQPVRLSLQPLPADDPFLGVVYGLGIVARRVTSDTVTQFYLCGALPTSDTSLHKVADGLLQVYGESDSCVLYGGARSVLLESVVAVDVMLSYSLDLSGKARMSRTDLVRRCTWFEQHFPGSFLLPEVRYRKALLLAKEGAQEAAKALLVAERDRSPIARLLYRNLATMDADAARLLKEPD
jgi:hypothetical protein